MNIIKKEISIQLKNLMEENGISKSSLAVLSGVSERTINKILNMETMPSTNIIEKICNAFCINTCQFFDMFINADMFKKELLA